MSKTLIAALLAATLTPSAAFADDFYMGVTAAKGGSYTFNNPINGKSDKEDAKAAFKLYGGYALNEMVALEAGYGQAGSTHFSKSALGLPGDPTFKMNSVYAAVRLTHQFNDAWSVFGKAGVARNQFKATDGMGTSDSTSSTKPLLGVGFAYNVTKAIAVTAEYEHIGKTQKPGLNIKQDGLKLGVKVGF
ncbi:hypothetical protein GCM10027277_42570 [Pseudoduganella ginsengisoli]|nr:outer membrane beta-barrel protein [Pseudoduganella ginsengisoli]